MRVTERFDGAYGYAYDAVMNRTWAMKVAGKVFRSSTVFDQLPELIRLAYAANPAEAMLDIPCGAASSLTHGKKVERTAAVVGVDLSEGMLQRAKKRVKSIQPAFPVELVKANALDLPFEDNSFGSVLSINGLHCMPSADEFFESISRVLRPGGELYLTTIVSTSSKANRSIERMLIRGNVIGVPFVQADQLIKSMKDLGWKRAEIVGGSALIAIRGIR